MNSETRRRQRPNWWCQLFIADSSKFVRICHSSSLLRLLIHLLDAFKITSCLIYVSNSSQS